MVQIATISGLNLRTVRSYMSQNPEEVREPSTSAALLIASVLGPDAVNAIISLIGYGGACPLEGEGEDNPLSLVASLMSAVNEITQRAADGDLCRDDRAELRPVVDAMIAKLVPLSSAGANV